LSNPYADQLKHRIKCRRKLGKWNRLSKKKPPPLTKKRVPSGTSAKSRTNINKLTVSIRASKNLISIASVINYCNRPNFLVVVLGRDVETVSGSPRQKRRIKVCVTNWCLDTHENVMWPNEKS
jgi:hypothetical protein